MDTGDYSGQWRCSIHTPLDVQDVLLVLDSDGDALAGEARGVETVPLIEPRVRDGRLSWTQKVTKPMRLPIAFDVVREGDRIVGIAEHLVRKHHRCPSMALAHFAWMAAD